MGESMQEPSALVLRTYVVIGKLDDEVVLLQVLGKQRNRDRLVGLVKIGPELQLLVWDRSGRRGGLLGSILSARRGRRAGDLLRCLCVGLGRNLGNVYQSARIIRRQCIQPSED